MLHAIEYFVPPTEAHGESGTEHPPACVPACDGKVYAHAANGLALLERYHFRVTRQHVLLADGGAALRPHSSHRTRAPTAHRTRAPSPPADPSPPHARCSPLSVGPHHFRESSSPLRLSHEPLTNRHMRLSPLFMTLSGPIPLWSHPSQVPSLSVVSSLSLALTWHAGDVADMWPLPFRATDRSHLDAARVCVLLNELRKPPTAHTLWDPTLCAPQ